MPQILKEEIKALFLTAARKLFSQKGFEEASMREIAHESGRSLGNLQNYFASKNLIFKELCTPVLRDISKAFESVSDLTLPGDFSRLQASSQKMLSMVEQFIVEHRETLNLLVDKSSGSDLANWKNTILEEYLELEIRTLENLKKQLPDLFDRPPSKLLIKGICEMYFNLALEFVRNRINEIEFRQAIKEFDAFRIAGLDALKEM